MAEMNVGDVFNYTVTQWVDTDDAVDLDNAIDAMIRDSLYEEQPDSEASRLLQFELRVKVVG